MSAADELTKLHELHKQGALSDDEFRALKEQLVKPSNPWPSGDDSHPQVNAAGSPQPSGRRRVTWLVPAVVTLLGLAGATVAVILSTRDDNSTTKSTQTTVRPSSTLLPTTAPRAIASPTTSPVAAASDGILSLEEYQQMRTVLIAGGVDSDLVNLPQDAMAQLGGDFCSLAQISSDSEAVDAYRNYLRQNLPNTDEQNLQQVLVTAVMVATFMCSDSLNI